MPSRFQPRDWVVAAVIAVVAGALRAVSLNVPSRALLDEFWYARDGCFYWRASVEACGMAGLVPPDRDVATWIATYGELTPEHPPLAKWLIGAPMAVLDYGAGVGRLSSLLVGVATVFLLYLLVRRLSGSTAIAAIAALLLAVDFLHFVHSRIAMLDVFTGFFAVAAVLFVTLDRDQSVLREAGAAAHRWWRAAAAVAAGCAAATKLSGAAVVMGVVVLMVLWAFDTRRNSSGRDPKFIARLAAAAGGVVGIAAVTYLLTYIGRVDGAILAIPWEEGSWLHAWWGRQAYMLDFYATGPSGASQPWQVPMMSPSLAYLLEDSPDGIREVLLFGNPLLWWGGFVAGGVALVDWLRRGPNGRPEVVVIGFLATYAGWLSLSLTGRPVHLYHAVPVAPFLYLALAHVVRRAWPLGPARVLVSAAVVASIVTFGFYFPILTALPLDRAAWEPRGCSAMTLWPSDVDGCGLE